MGIFDRQNKMADTGDVAVDQVVVKENGSAKQENCAPSDIEQKIIRQVEVMIVIIILFINF